MQKINRTTGDRAQDEDFRRLYDRGDKMEAAIAALKGTTAAPVSVNPGVITPLPSVSGGTTVQPVEVLPVVGTLPSFAHEDHAHNGMKQVYVDASVPAGNTIANTSADTAFASSYTIPANLLAVGMSLRVKLYGVYSLITGSQVVEWKVKLGSQTVLDSGTITIAGPDTSVGWTTDADLFVTAIGASGKLEIQGVSQMGAATSGSTINLPNTSPYTVDTTASQTITFTWQFTTANAGNTTTLRAARVEILQ